MLKDAKIGKQHVQITLNISETAKHPMIDMTTKTGQVVRFNVPPNTLQVIRGRVLRVK